jgi:uncharacterized protein YycO
VGKITEAAMQAADIIVSTATGAASAVIRTGSFSRFSHAALYIGGGEVVEAIGEGVVKRSLTDKLLHDTLAVVYRRKYLSSAQAGLVVQFAKRQVGKPYDFAGVAGASSHTTGGFIARFLFIPIGVVQDVGALSNMISPDSKFFCSELVLRAFQEADAPVTAGSPQTSAPGDIPLSHLVEYVGDLKGA